MTKSLYDIAVKKAIAAIESEAATLPEKVDMLIEVAAGLHKQSKSPKQTQDAVYLFCRAIEICPHEEPLLRARALTGMGTALRTIPSQGAEILLEAKMAYETALPILQEHASPEAVAEVHMNLGLVLQALVPANEARMQEAIQSYQRALRVFTGKAYPQEHAILQNNIAIAYFAMSSAPETRKTYQSLAIQAFEEALQWVTPIDRPNEYAMLRNNLAKVLDAIATER